MFCITNKTIYKLINKGLERNFSIYYISTFINKNTNTKKPIMGSI